MSFILDPWQLLLVVLAGWINRQQQEAIEYLRTENAVHREKRYILIDRDSSFSSAFRSALEEEGVKCVRLPPRSPNLNPHLERYHLSVKSECLSKMMFFGEEMLRRAVREYLAHYHTARNHQGLKNRIIDPGKEVGRSEGEIVCDERLGGLLRYYRRAA